MILLPAQSERRQQQHHEDEEGVAFVHRCPVFTRPADREESDLNAMKPFGSLSPFGPLTSDLHQV